MVPATSSSRERTADQPGAEDRSRGLSTYTLLLTVLLLIVALLTGASLFAVWHEMRKQVVADFSQELDRSVTVFKNAEAERLRSLQTEDDLLADLPSLKALMTTNDERTIADGALEFWRTSGNDLFALADRNGQVRAAYAAQTPADARFRQDLSRAMTEPDNTYLLSGNRLFVFAVSPMYFGDERSGVLLGYVVTGYPIDTAYLNRISRQFDAEVSFLTRGSMVASSLPLSSGDLEQLVPVTAEPRPITIRSQRYLGVRRRLSDTPIVPLEIIMFKSLRTPEEEMRSISRLLLLLGIGATLLGSACMVWVVRRVTEPLEALTSRVRTYDAAKLSIGVDLKGTREVRELTATFGEMQERVERSNRARLESERLATIGSMASSVSHDLRHYLASIYANAEFLSQPDTTDEERAEFFGDIRTAVMGTTEMLESLMTFSRTGSSVRRQRERMQELVRRAITQVRLHPDAAGMNISASLDEDDVIIDVDTGQVERALYNLLLNACQSPRQPAESAFVKVDLVQQPSTVTVRIVDNGCGVSRVVQETLFDPFVSQGKQKGTGLGLTLCRCVAQEHGGEVNLVSSRPGETVFELVLPRVPVPADAVLQQTFQAEV